MERIFLALTLPAETKDFIDHINKRWQSHALKREIRWIPKRNLHITLKFIGDTPSETIKDITTRCDTLLAKYREIPTSLQHTGMFPNVRFPRILWAGLNDPKGQIAALQHSLEKGLEDMGINREQRKFTPHITLARIKNPSRIDETFKKQFLGTDLNEDLFILGQVVLFKSILKPTGAEYSAIKSWQLLSG